MTRGGGRSYLGVAFFLVTEFPEIRRKIPHRKDAVSSLRIYVHNIRRYGYMEHLQPELLKPLRN